ncbi:metalloregulator ArsR/SmtB family transcription factor [bacterium]|nr:metalloregulator ArsR/SmtB family transcription factor [bacterium]
MRRDVFQAIADPNRRAILSLLATQNLPLNGVAEHFKISRPAVSKHVKILTQCGLIEIKKDGRERYCEARLDRLNEVSTWVEQYRKFWEQKLDALESYLIELQAKDKKRVKKRR